MDCVWTFSAGWRVDEEEEVQKTMQDWVFETKCARSLGIVCASATSWKEARRSDRMHGSQSEDAVCESARAVARRFGGTARLLAFPPHTRTHVSSHGPPTTSCTVLHSNIASIGEHYTCFAPTTRVCSYLPHALHHLPRPLAVCLPLSRTPHLTSLYTQHHSDTSRPTTYWLSSLLGHRCCPNPPHRTTRNPFSPYFDSIAPTLYTTE